MDSATESSCLEEVIRGAGSDVTHLGEGGLHRDGAKHPRPVIGSHNEQDIVRSHAVCVPMARDVCVASWQQRAEKRDAIVKERAGSQRAGGLFLYAREMCAALLFWSGQCLQLPLVSEEPGGDGGGEAGCSCTDSGLHFLMDGRGNQTSSS